jgi:hypothetical protein
VPSLWRPLTKSEQGFLRAISVQRSTRAPFIPINKIDMADKQIWFTALRRNFPDLQVWTLTFRGNLCSFMTYVHCKFTSLKGSSVRGTKATGLYKHCRYFVNMTHYDVEFRCLLLENLDNVAQLLPGAYVSELHITERRAAVPVQQNAHPSASGQSAVTPTSSVHYDADQVTTFALPRIPFAAFNYPRVSPPVQTADEQLRCDLTDNESWGTADSDPSALPEENSFHPRHWCELRNEAAPRTPQPSSGRTAMHVSGAHSNAYPFWSQHPHGWPGPCRSRDTWHPAAASTPPNYLQAESATSREVLRRQDSEGDLLCGEFSEPSGDWGPMLKATELRNGMDALGLSHATW